MNLSEASAKNNYELAVLFKGEDYLKVIGKVKSEAKEIISDSTSWDEIRKKNLSSKNPGTNLANSSKANPKNQSKVYTTHNSLHDNNELRGYCIRCNTAIKLNHLRPFCIDCFNDWVEWENDYYKENFDHFTGEKSNGDTSMALPILSKNWKKYAKETGN